MLQCAKMRVHGPHEWVVGRLIDAIGGMTVREEIIGKAVLQRRSAQGPTDETKQIVEAMKRRMKDKPGLSQRGAAESVLTNDKLGTSAEANRQAFKRYA